MAGQYIIKLEGLNELVRALESGNKRAGTAIAKAMLATVQTAEREIKLVTPVRTGRLRASIRHSVGKLEGSVFTDVHYGGYVEFGTRRMRPRRMFWRGVQAAMPQVRTYWESALRSLW